MILTSKGGRSAALPGFMSLQINNSVRQNNQFEDVYLGITLADVFSQLLH